MEPICSHLAKLGNFLTPTLGMSVRCRDPSGTGTGTPEPEWGRAVACELKTPERDGTAPARARSAVPRETSLQQLQGLTASYTQLAARTADDVAGIEAHSIDEADRAG